MDIKELEIKDSFFIRPKQFNDSRGLFYESWQKKRYQEITNLDFVQDNLSYSEKNVLRGMHYQVEHPIGQLVWLIDGVILDVLVDLRQDSPTFKKITTKELQKGEQIYMPPGIAHGFCVLSDSATVHYKCTEFYYPNDEGGIHVHSLGIDWPIQNPIISDKDQSLPPIDEAQIPKA